jgi:hypothetical protein
MKDAPFIDLLIRNKTYKKHLSVCVNYKWVYLVYY